MSIWNEILSINRRNVDYVFKANPRRHRELVDSKVMCKQFMQDHHLPQAPLLGVVEAHVMIKPMIAQLRGRGHFVIKPNHGFGGTGILIVDACVDGGWKSISGKFLNDADLGQHMANILYGVYSSDNSMDTVLIEEKIETHSFFADLAFKGIPDLRLITYRGRNVMAMLRLPTRHSDGKANLHSGGLGVAVDLATGRTFRAMSKEGLIEKHPDTLGDLHGLTIPFWDQILEQSQRAAALIPLGYLGFDWVIDQNLGPLILEINARPGLEIQNVNGRGLRSLLEAIDEQAAKEEQVA